MLGVAIQGYLESVRYSLSGGGGGVVDLANGYPADGTPDRTEVETLQTIYGSTDGFRDADGNAITVGIQDIPNVTEIEHLEERGYYNPLKSGGYDAWLTAQNIKFKLGEESTVVVDSTTRRPDIKTGAGIVPVARQPDGNMNVLLEDWRTIAHDADSFYFRLVFPSGATIARPAG